MQLLDATNYGAVLPLIPRESEAGHMTFVHAVIEGTMPGQIAVDDAQSPKTAIVLNDCGFHALLGALPDEELPPLLEWISNEVMSDEPGMLIDVTGEWSAALEPLLGTPYGRKEYHPPLNPPASPPMPGSFELHPLTPEIADKFDGAVDPWVVRIWGGRDEFIAKAFGYAVMTPSGELASFCTTCGLGAGEAEIEIGTNPAYRQRGLARAAAVAFIEEAWARGLNPAWTCQADNEPSWRLADSLGFREFRTVNCFTFNRGWRAEA